jgi:hypothetical protein
VPVAQSAAEPLLVVFGFHELALMMDPIRSLVKRLGFRRGEVSDNGAGKPLFARAKERLAGHGSAQQVRVQKTII